MIELKAFTRVFSLDENKVRIWCRLLGMKIEGQTVEPRACEQLVMMRYLIEKLDEAEALALVGMVFEDVDGPVPVFSIVNGCLLVIGANEYMYMMKTGERVLKVEPVVYTSLAVNVEQFASAIAQSSAVVLASLPESEGHPAPGGDVQRSEAAGLVSEPSDLGGL